MSGSVSLRPGIVGLSLLLAASAAAQAGDRPDGHRPPHTHHERSGSVAEDRALSRSERGTDFDRADEDRHFADRGNRVFSHPVPDYRVVRNWQGEADLGADAGWYRERYAVGALPEWRAPPSVIVGSGRFSGNVEAWYRRGAGSYFTIMRYDEEPRSWRRSVTRNGPARPTTRSRVISVDSSAPQRNDRACSFEAGVCVIRGG